MRTATAKRETRETKISATVNLDGTGASEITTGIGFLDHMLEQLARHGHMDISLKCQGDLHIDGHHTTEDCGLALGSAIRQALGEKKGIRRFGSAYIAMDECLTRAVVDISGRPFLVFKLPFTLARLGDMDTELFEEFFRAFAFEARITLHVENLYGKNNHHMIESAFKATARALRDACAIDPSDDNRVPSTKGTL